MRGFSDLASKAATQYGLLTSQQVLGSGLSRGQLSGLINSGFLDRLAPGVHRLPGSEPTWKQRLLAVCLAPGPPTVASHRSAMRLWGMRTVDDEIEVTVRYPADRSVGGRVTLHRSRDLVPGDLTWVEGIPTTEPVRTICDAGAIFPDREVQRILDHSIAIGLVKRVDLWRFRRRVGRQGRCGVGPLHRALESLPVGAELVESGPELELLRLCRESGLPEPVPQLWVVAGGRSYRVDIAYPDARVAIEYDGYEAHTGRDRFTDDRRRQNDLVLAGWIVVRYTAADLRDRPGRVIQEIRRALAAAVPLL